MADNFGLKIGVEGEKEFKNALREINRDFKVLGSEMKLVTSSFDKQDKSIQAVTARNSVLNKEIDTQKSKISTLESALSNAAKSFGENDKRTKAWQIQLNNANADLNKMERELRDNNKTLDASSDGFDEAGKKADKFADAIEDTGKVAGDSGHQFEKLGSIMKGLATGLGVAMTAIGASAVAAGKKLYDLANEAAATGDAIDKGSQRLGLSRKGYQEWDYILSQNGASISSLENGMKKLNKTVDDAINGSTSATEEFERLGISIDDLQGKSREEVFEMTIQGLQGITDEGQKAAIANNLLGTSSVQLGSLLNQTAESTAHLKLKAGELGLVMNDAAVNAAVNYTDAMDNLKRSFSGVKNNITAELLPSFTMILDGLTGLITGQEGASELLKEGARSTVEQITIILPQILEVISELISAIAAVAPDLILALVTGILDNLDLLIEAATNIMMTLVEGIIEALPQMTEGALQLVLTLVNGIVENLPAIVEAAIVMITTLALGLSEALPQLVPSIIQAIILIAETLINNLELILNAAFQVISALAQGLLNALPVLIEALPKIIETIILFITNNLPKIIEMGLQITIQLGAGLIKAIPLLVKQLPQIIKAIVEGLMNGISSITEVGKNMTRGIWEGLQSMTGWLKSKVDKMVSGIVSGIKRKLGIRSPSKVFAGIGANMGEGIGEGFEEAMSTVEKDMQQSIPTDFDLDLNSKITGGFSMTQGAVFDVTIPLSIDGNILTRVIAQLQWNQNTVTVRNLGVAST